MVEPKAWARLYRRYLKASKLPGWPDYARRKLVENIAVGFRSGEGTDRDYNDAVADLMTLHAVGTLGRDQIQMLIRKTDRDNTLM
ncbi:Uncharacterized protein PBTT_03403 [Plasmodiophora brassicae]